MGKYLRFASALVALVIVAVAVPSASQTTEPTVTFTAAGDIGSGPNSRAVLSSIGALDRDAHFALGDLSYGATGAEQSWCDLVTERVGAGFPFELLAGNHESNGINGNINDFSACLPNQLPGLVGTYGRQYYVDVPAGAPLVRYVMISPAIIFPDGTWSYAAGTPRYAWTASAIDGARTAGIPWVVVGMHKPCLSLGQYACEPGTDLVDMLLAKGVDLVLSGHEHLYQRTKQLALGSGCPSLTPGTFRAACVADADSTLAKGAGTVMATVGTGGVELRPVSTADAERDYFAAWSGSNADPTHGTLDVSVTADRLTATFVRAAGGGFTDAFTIDRDEPAPTTTTTSTTTSSSTTTAPPPTTVVAADDFSRTVSNGLGSATVGGAWTTAGTRADFSVSGGVGRIRLLSPGAGRYAYLTGALTDEADTRITWSTDKAGTGSGTYISVMGRRVPDAGDYRLKTRIEGGAVRAALTRANAAGTETMLTPYVLVPGHDHAGGGQLHVRLQVLGTSPTQLRAKVWSAGQAEPATWMLTASDTTSGLQVPGSFGVFGYLSGSTSNAPVVLTLDDLSVVEP